jgi:hypothetical protein
LRRSYTRVMKPNSAVRADDAGQHAQQRALASAVPADDPQRFAPPDLERDVVQGPELVPARVHQARIAPIAEPHVA